MSPDMKSKIAKLEADVALEELNARLLKAKAESISARLQIQKCRDELTALTSKK